MSAYAWDIYLDGKLVDSIMSNIDDKETLRDWLIEFEGYSKDIIVKKGE